MYNLQFSSILAFSDSLSNSSRLIFFSYKTHKMFLFFKTNYNCTEYKYVYDN